jgi:hypothetical protein
MNYNPFLFISSNLFSLIVTTIAVNWIWNSNGLHSIDRTTENLLLRQRRTQQQQCCSCSVPTNIPPGPYITAANANERVKIPDPPLPTFPARSNCPHLGTSLLDWHSSSTWGGVVPTSGDVTLPRNAKVIVRRSVVGVLGTVTIVLRADLL